MADANPLFVGRGMTEDEAIFASAHVRNGFHSWSGAQTSRFLPSALFNFSHFSFAAFSVAHVFPFLGCFSLLCFVFCCCNESDSLTSRYFTMKQAVLDVDGIIDALLKVQYMEPNTEVDLPEEQIMLLIEAAQQIFASQPVLLDLQTPIKICGSLLPLRFICRRCAWSVLRLATALHNERFSPRVRLSLFGVAFQLLFSRAETTWTGERTASKCCASSSPTK